MDIDSQNIAIIHEHYHVTDAGIRLVLESLSHGIAQFLNKPRQFLWYSPRKIQGQATPFEHFSDRHMALIEDEELGYLTTTFNSVDHFDAAIEKRKRFKISVLKEKLGKYDTIIHIIQNPALLKNPVETQANSRIASELLAYRYIQIWHIHDLLEDSASRQKLRDHIKQVAGRRTEAEYGRNGCGIAWTTSPNIFYALINMKATSAIRHFLPPHLKQSIFYFPDPVDIERINTRPFFVRDGVSIDDRILDFCRDNSDKGYTYDPDAQIIIASEFARERKNTGEQILILNMLNQMDGHLNNKFQLLVTLTPTTGKDAERIAVFEEFIKVNRLSVAMGFGSRVISRGNELKEGQFTITDLWCHPKACFTISTSVKEGFGLNFINPAIATMDMEYALPTVGRRLADIFPDFQAAGMLMPNGAFYDAITIEHSVLHCENAAISKEENVVNRSRLPKRYQTVSYDGTIELGKDFSHYSADEQILLMDLIDYNQLSKRLADFIDCALNKGKMSRITKKNAMAIMRTLTLESYTTKLKKIIVDALELKEKRLTLGEKPTRILDNTKLIDYYRTIEETPFSDGETG